MHSFISVFTPNLTVMLKYRCLASQSYLTVETCSYASAVSEMSQKKALWQFHFFLSKNIKDCAKPSLMCFYGVNLVHCFLCSLEGPPTAGTYCTFLSKAQILWQLFIVTSKYWMAIYLFKETKCAPKETRDSFDLVIIMEKKETIKTEKKDSKAVFLMLCFRNYLV